MSSLSKQDVEFLRWQVEKGGPSPDEYDEMQNFFHRVGDIVREGRASRPEVNAEFRSLIKPLLTKPDNLIAKTILKPYGYAGDFEIIDNFYTYWFSDNPFVAKWDEFSQWQKAPQAVRNRKQYFIESVKQFVEETGKTKYHVLDIGSGPGRDVLEYLESHQKNGTQVYFDCVDMDSHAIAYAKKLCRAYEGQIEFYQKNAFRYKTTRQYDLIWSAGLFDYLTDEQFIFLLKRLHSMSQSGGRVILGNFSTDNPSRDYMEAGDWYLHHRTESDLIRLALASGIRQDAITVERERTGVNLFLVIDGL